MAEEDFEEYVEGGYHPVQIGDEFAGGRYTVARKLGWGHFSTVWLAKDANRGRHVALKIVKSAERYTETAIDEIKLLQRLNTADLSHPGRRYVVSLLDSFRHQGPNGIHVCMVFEVLGENLLGLIRSYRDRTIPVGLVKHISAQILVGLEYMHDKCGIIHTDLKPENVMLWIDDVEAVVSIELANSSSIPRMTGSAPSKSGKSSRSNSISILGSQPLPSPSSSSSSLHDKTGFTMSSIKEASEADVIVKVLESVRIDSPIGKKSSPTNKHSSGPSLLSQLAPRKKPSFTTGSPFDSPPLHFGSMEDPEEGEEQFDHVRVVIADFGNATWANHHFTDDIQTRQYRSPEVILGGSWGSTADTWSIACMIFELLTGGDFLFDPASAPRYSKDDDHLAQVIELVGELPVELTRDGRYSNEFFDENGKLKRITKLRRWPMSSVLAEKYLFPPDEAAMIASFLVPMLHPEPTKRTPASTLRRHPWLRGVTLP